MEYDDVKCPSHYCFSDTEPRKAIRDWELNFNLGSAVKYIIRAGRKNDAVKDLEKAKQFIDFEIEALSQQE